MKSLGWTIITFWLVLVLGAGCGGGDEPKPTKTRTPKAKPTRTQTPEEPAEEETPVELPPELRPTPYKSPEMTEDEKADIAYRETVQKAKDLVLAKNFKEALPGLDEALKKRPKDPELQFLYLLAHGGLEAEPTPDSTAYKHAQQLIEMMPDSNEAERAHEYMVAAHSEEQLPSPVGAPSIEAIRWELDPHAAYQLQGPTTMLTLDRGADPKLQRLLWQLEVYPDAVAEKATLAAGTQLAVLEQISFPYSKTAWRERIPAITKDHKGLDSNVYHLNAVRVEVVKLGEGKTPAPGGKSPAPAGAKTPAAGQTPATGGGKTPSPTDIGKTPGAQTVQVGTRGWLVNQMDRWAGDRPDAPNPWAVLVPDRLGLKSAK